MPPRTRANKLSKALKENAYVPLKKTAGKDNNHTVKEKRKPLADKTNSASDDNETNSKLTNYDKMRPRRDRRLPSRFIDNNLLVNLSTSFSHSTPVKTGHKQKDDVIEHQTSKKDVSKVNSDKNNNPDKEKRIQTRAKDILSPVLKTRLNDINPVSRTREKNVNGPVSTSTAKNNTTPVSKTRSKNIENPVSELRVIITPLSKPKVKNAISPVSVFEANNVISPVLKTRSKGLISPISKNTAGPKKEAAKVQIPNYKKDFSCRILEDKESPKKGEEKLAVYDFTFDPLEEPPPQKKKKKKVVRKKAPPKPKIYHNFYEQNVFNTLETLRNVVKQKLVNNHNSKPIPVVKKVVEIPVTVHESPRQEDVVHFSDLNYSPCTSPNDNNRKTSDNNVPDLRPKSNNTKLVNKNLINIQDEISFFDDQPIANSSMNESVRNPNSSPWRVDFKELPIKWGVNSYVKANMTPAVECSYINPEETGKKHIYTNILFNDLDKVNTSDNPKLKQTSITSFMKDGVDKVIQNKNKVLTPTKENSVFNDSKSDCSNPGHLADDICVPEMDISPNKNNKNNKSKSPLKRRNDEVSMEVPAKIRKEVVATVENFFGFDESTIIDQENISPNKNAVKAVRKPKSHKKVLLESNQVVGPMRAHLPRCAKDKMLEIEMPVVLASDKDINTEINLEQPIADSDLVEECNSRSDKGDSSSIGLFEDIEIVHYNKPIRKSYGKAKKVTFQQTEVDPEKLDCDTTGDSDLVDDTSFHVPVVKVRKTVKKKVKVQKLSKKEEKEAEAWAAGFNSMCEDVDNFDLLVE